ncbi:unnamed protein product [Mortierella alpina]
MACQTTMAGRAITSERYRDILEHKRKHPDITLEDLAAWVRDAFDLARTPRTSTINQILNNADKVPDPDPAPVPTPDARLNPSVLSPLLNKALEYWIVHRQSQMQPPTRREIREKAQILAADIGLPQDKPGFAATWWSHFARIHGICNNNTRGDFAISIADRNLLAESVWSNEQLIDLACERLELTEEVQEPTWELDAPASPPSSPHPTWAPSLEASSNAQRPFVRRLRKRYPNASHGVLAEYAKMRFGAAHAPSEAGIAEILGETSTPTTPAVLRLNDHHHLAWLNEVQCARIYQYAQCNPGFTYSTIAAWAYYELGLERKLAAGEVEQVISTFQGSARPYQQELLRGSAPPLTPFQRRKIRKKWEENPSFSAMALMCWAKSKFRLPGAPTVEDISEIHAICNGGSEIRRMAAQPMPPKNGRDHRAVEYWTRNRRLMSQSTWYKKHIGSSESPRSSDVPASGNQGRPAPYQETTLSEPVENSQPKSWLFGIPSLGVIGCLTSESLHCQRFPGSAVGFTDEHADHDGENSSGHGIIRNKAHGAFGGYELVSDDIGDEADDERDDVYGGYSSLLYTTVDGEGLEKRSEGVRIRNARQKSSWTSSAPDETDAMEHSDRSEGQSENGAAIDQRAMMHRKEDQMGVERDEEDTYMDMDVDEASCILSAMGISKEIENSIDENEMGPDPGQSWTQEQQSTSLQVALTTLDPNDLTQRSAYVVLLDMSRRITTLDEEECFQEHLRAISQRWSQEEQLQSLFTVATLLDMQNPFHFAAYVVLTNRYNRIKDFE